jgi:hypothetical protein
MRSDEDFQFEVQADNYRRTAKQQWLLERFQKYYDVVRVAMCRRFLSNACFFFAPDHW